MMINEAHMSHAMTHSMDMALPAGPTMSDLTSASLLPDVAMGPIDIMRSPTCKCLLALPSGTNEVIWNPPAGEGTIVAPMPVRLAEAAGAGAELMELNLETHTNS